MSEGTTPTVASWAARNEPRALTEGKSETAHEEAKDEPSVVWKYVVTVIAVLILITGGIMLAGGISNFADTETWLDPSGNRWRSFGNWCVKALLPVAAAVALFAIGGKMIGDKWRRGATTAALAAGRAVRKSK